MFLIIQTSHNKQSKCILANLSFFCHHNNQQIKFNTSNLRLNIISPHRIIFRLCYVLHRHHTLWEWQHSWKHRTVTIPYGIGSFPERSSLTSYPMGIDPLQDVEVIWHQSYTMMTDMNGSHFKYRITNFICELSRWQKKRKVGKYANVCKLNFT